MWDPRCDDRYTTIAYDVTNVEWVNADFKICDYGDDVFIVTHGGIDGSLQLPNKTTIDASTWCDIVSEMFPRLHNKFVRVIACHEDCRINDDDEFQALNEYGTRFDVTPLGAKDPSYSGVCNDTLSVSYIPK